MDYWEFIDLEKDPYEMTNAYSNPENAREIARLGAELERLRTELKVPPLEINTRSYLFDEEMQQRRPQQQQLFDKVRRNVEQRREVLNNQGK